VGINNKMRCTDRKRGFKQRLYFNLIYESKNYILRKDTFLRTNPKIYEHKLTKLEMGLTVCTNTIFITGLPKMIKPTI